MTVDSQQTYFRNDANMPSSPYRTRSQSRREVCDRIIAAASQARDYESGSVHATEIALAKARAIHRDAELLMHSLELRLAEIKGA